MIKCGIDIGGTYIKIGFFSLDNELINSIKISTPKYKDQLLNLITNSISKYYDFKDIYGYTILVPGVVENNVVICAPNCDIVGINIYDYYSKLFNNTNIIVGNDASLTALAEAYNSNTKDLLLITIGTGIGGGIILNNRLLNLPFAGEIGHIKVDDSKYAYICGCSKRGCVEQYCSIKGITRYYNNKYNCNIGVKELFRLSYDGDKAATKSINYSAKKFALMLSNVVSTLGIKEIRIAGGLSYYNYLINLIKKYYSYYSIPNLKVNISRASLGNDAGIHICKYLII